MLNIYKREEEVTTQYISIMRDFTSVFYVQDLENTLQRYILVYSTGSKFRTSVVEQRLSSFHSINNKFCDINKIIFNNMFKFFNII